MTFINWAMLFGLAALLVPILIHLLNRSRAKVLDWGAMRFLLASLTSQNRRILIEEIILLALRCLLVALVVLAMARPFLPSRSQVPWAIVLPAVLGAAICLGVAAAMWHYRKARWALIAAAIVLGAAAGTASAIERWVQELKWASGGGERDVAILIDGSMSMTIYVEGRTNFDRAVEEARQVVAACSPGDAMSVILAGPVPRAVIAQPTADRQEIAAALDGLQPVGGTMSVLEALNVAAASLAEGNNSVKKIVLITDGQNVGWDVRSELRWRFLADGLKALPAPPRIICRMLPMPTAYRNVAIADLAFSRKVVGTDRPVRINVKVMNTGTVALKPSAVELSVDGAPVATERIVTDIQPKAAETVRFEHKFKEPGPRLVSARVIASDDLPADNISSRVLAVIDKLDVLIVDGTPSPRPLGGAADFIEIGLTPRGEDEEPQGGDAKSPMPDANPKAPDPKSKAASSKSKTGKPSPEPTEEPDQIDYLVAPKVVPAPEIGAVRNLSDYPVIILANVSRLPEAVAKDLVRFVESGGGLLVAPGVRVKPTFYNSWATTASAPVMPAQLAERRDVDQQPSRLESRSFTHPALRILADSKQSDVATAILKSYWKLEANEKDPDVRVGGRLNTGEPFLVERKLGKGYVLLLAAALDPTAGNLPTLKSFVPMLHELVYYLASPMMLDANVAPGSDVTLELHSRSRAGAAGAGLRGDYFSDTAFARLKATRVDPAVDFAWSSRRPHPALGSESYSVRWTGWVQPLYSEDYDFYAVGDDGVRLWVEGRQLADGWRGQIATEYRGSIRLSAGRRYPIKLEYYQDAGDAAVRLLWSSRSQRKEVVPQSALYPAWSGPAAPREAAAGEGAHGPEVLTPSQRRLPAKVAADNGTLRVSFSETQEPGLYTLTLPPDLAQIYAPDSADGSRPSRSEGIPFVVLSRIEESSLDTLTKGDLDLAGQHVDLFETERTDELTSAVSGGVPGEEELWKYLAMGALFALLAEIGVTRWIAVQRRLHTAETIDFGFDAPDVQTFRDRAQQLLAIPKQPALPVPKP